MNRIYNIGGFRAALICLGIFLLTPLAAGAASLSLEPVLPLAKGVVFQVDIYADSISGVYGLAMDLEYDPAILAVVDKDARAAGVQPRVTEGSVLDGGGVDQTLLEAALEDGKQGKLVFGVSRTRTDTAVDIGVHQKLASVFFIPLVTGPAAISIADNAFYGPDTTELSVDSWTGATLDILSSFTITATSGGHGAIVPSGDVAAAQGYDKTFSFAPDSGYVLDYLEIDAVRTAPAASYTFVNVTENHVITAYFRIMPGDFDGDTYLTLKDAVVISKILSGINTGFTLNLDADVAGDGKIDTTDLVYILEKLGGLR